MQRNGAEKFFLHKLIRLRPNCFINLRVCVCVCVCVRARVFCLYITNKKSTTLDIFKQDVKHWKQQENEPKNK